MIIKKFENFEFKEVEKSKRNKLYIVLHYMGGDGDYYEDIPIELGIKFTEFKNHLPEINKEIEKYEMLSNVIEAMRRGRNTYQYHKFIVKDPSQVSRNSALCTVSEDELGEFFDNYVPMDPTGGDDYLCSMINIFLIGYDEEGNKHKSQAKRV